MWRACLPFWSAAYVQSVSSNNNKKPSPVWWSLTQFFNLYLRNICRQTSNLLTFATVMCRTLTSILSCCLGHKCVSSNNDIKALPLCDSCFSHICITRPKNHQPNNKQLVNHLYDDMESWSSILSWCNGVKIIASRKDPLALSHEDNHFFITLAENHLQTN